MGVNKELRSETTTKDSTGFKKLFTLRRVNKKTRDGEQEGRGSRGGMENDAFAPRDGEPPGDAEQEPGAAWHGVWADGFHEDGSSEGARVRFAPMAGPPDRYEQLVTDEDKEEMKRRKKEKHKKYRKNMGRALRRGWTYFFAGVTLASTFYVSPWTVASTVTKSPQ